MKAGLWLDEVYAAYDKADVLQGVSLAAAPGKITCLLGSNGSGKTTVIRAILGLTRARAGRITLDGVELTHLATHKIIAAGVACIPEGRKVFPKLTTEENLRLGAYQETDRDAVGARMEKVFTIFPRLKERRRQVAGTLSGGEQAMVSIGRGLMAEPKFLLIDEPSLGLSPLYVKENFKVIRDVAEQGVSVFLVEQNVRQTLAIAHYGYVLSQGRVVAAGSAEELKQDEEVHKAYFGQ
jgi:branched-chain amino acid transport system ATP-binding protein